MRWGGETMPTAANLSCPRCGQNDNVQSVSAVVSQGSSSSIITGYGSAYFGESQSILSRRLSPPVRPEKAAFWGCGTYALTAIVGSWLLIAIMATAGSASKGEGGLAAFGFIFLVMLPLIAYVLIARFLVGKHNEDFSAASRAFESRLNDWRKQYYCHRCDLTYTPKNS